MEMMKPYVIRGWMDEKIKKRRKKKKREKDGLYFL